MKKSLLYICFVVFGSLSCFSQQEKMFTQYLNYPTSINPAYAGSRGTLQLFGLARRQWVGIDGAPKSFVFSMNTPLHPFKLGTGLSLERDELGPEQNTKVGVDLSYQLQVAREVYLNFGIKADLAFYKANLSGSRTVDQGDPLLQQDIRGEFLPNFGVGAYLYGQRFFVGLSVPAMFKTSLDVNSNTSERIAYEEAHYYLMGGYLFDLNLVLKLKPSFLVKAVPGAPLSYDLTSMLIFYDRLWLGAAYRNEDAIAAIVQCNVTNQFRIGYAYDFGTSSLSGRSKGSHEISLSYDLTFNSRKLKSPRYF
ncbi:MAG: type IX secretion system membrane protein PorP/SprF [Marinifilaceae bacterium]